MCCCEKPLFKDALKMVSVQTQIFHAFMRDNKSSSVYNVYHLVWMKLDEPHNMVLKFRICQTFHALNILRMTDDAIDLHCMKICVLRGYITYR